MNRFLAGLFVGLISIGPTAAKAQDLIAEYYTLISVNDMYNSNGVRLGDWCAMIQQDRVNYHRFGRRDDGDRGDPIFASREARAAIPGTCRAAPHSEYIPQFLESGRTRYVFVRIYGYGNFPQLLLISEGAG